MDILSLKPSHDGHIAYIRNGVLEFSIEAEKDSGERYGVITPDLCLRAFQYVEHVPDVVALSGWAKNKYQKIGAGYWGVSNDSIISGEQKFLGKKVKFFSSSHERSHLLCSYGLSPFEQGRPCYGLVWEGIIGSFYRIDEMLEIKKLGSVLSAPGVRYQFLYALADPGFPDDGRVRHEDAGKLMALASYGSSRRANSDESEVIKHLLSGKWTQEERTLEVQAWKSRLNHTKYYNCGVESAEFKQLARVFSDTLLERFMTFAKKHMREGLPLLISGGCGLNCDWNSEWKNSGLFEDVFVPPCANDSGSAIGTALDALHYYTGKAKIDWSVYAGENFWMDGADMSGIEVKALDLREVVEFIRRGKIIAWVEGRYEIGPRALGNRSIIGMPFSKEIHGRLNKIKGREGFRPIAPICLEEEMGRLFSPGDKSPYMLYFQHVLTNDLPAITHVDGSARVQSVNREQNPIFYELLCMFKEATGFGVLCNTSLNFNGRGFINRMSDLVRYCRKVGLDGFVVNERFYRFVC